MTEWRPIESKVEKYFDQYEGYISSHDYKREDDEKLAELAKRIGVGDDGRRNRTEGVKKTVREYATNGGEVNSSPPPTRL